MTREELEHAIRAACDVAEDDELWVFGSQAILSQYADAPEELRMSSEVDVAPVNEESKTIDIDANLGELSRFHQAYGFYVHGVSIEAAVLPKGWERRAKNVCNANTGQPGPSVSLPPSRGIAVMTDLLQRAYNEAAKLPPEEQDELARAVLRAIEGERSWDELFAQSQDLLADMADDAEAEYDAGKTEPLLTNDDD